MIRLAAALALSLVAASADAQTVGPRPPSTAAGGITQLQGDVQTPANSSGLTNSTTLASGAPYRTGNYYIAGNVVPAAAGGLAGSATKMSCYPGTVNKVVTISGLASYASTASSGGNFQQAIYTDNAGRPGALVANSSASGSTGTVGPVPPTATALTIQSAYTGTLAGGTSAAGNVQLGPMTTAGKEIWWCSEVDNTTAVFYGTSNAGGTGPSFIGSTTLLNVTSSSAAIAGITTPSTFGTWPTSLTGVTWTDQISRATPLVAFMVASVP